MPTLILPITNDGSIVEALVGPSHQRTMALLALKQPVPPPVRVRLLIDTGATSTSISQGLLISLKLVTTGTVQLHTASSAGIPVDCEQYDVSLVYGFEKAGVLRDANDDKTVIPMLDRPAYHELKTGSLIFAGMIPKLDNAFEALDKGVKKVIIADIMKWMVCIQYR